jgi:hypothetical protein
MPTKYYEKIVYHEDQFVIERRFPDKQKPSEYLPLSSLGFVKSLTAIAIIKRFSENLESLEEPQNLTFYEVTLSFEVLETPLARPIYLKAEQSHKILSESLRHVETYTSIWIKNAENGQLHSAQLENVSGFPYSMISVKKSRPKRIPFAKAKELLDSGVLVGIFRDKELSEQLI